MAAHVIFPPDSVSEDRTVTVVRWNPLACSPPLKDNETLVSDVIQLSTDSSEALEFNKSVTLVISHCSADLKGYEIVVKKLIDMDSNGWDDILETVELRSLAGKEGNACNINVVLKWLNECLTRVLKIWL